MPTFIRVRAKDTGDEFDVAAGAYDPETMTKLNASKQYPDTSAPRAAKYRTDKAGQPATTSKES